MVRGWTPGVTPSYCRLPRQKKFRDDIGTRWDTEISLGLGSNGIDPLIPDYRNILSMEGFERGKQADYQRLLIR